MGAVRFQRVAAAFDEVSRVRLCESSGSEYSAAGESFADLSNLVKSFIERGDLGEGGGDRDGVRNDEESEGGDWSDSETKNSLERLFDVKGDDLKKTIADEVEVALAGIGDDLSRGFKRRLMTHLRHKGFDAEVDELKKIVRLMCTAIKKSMKSVDMPMPPWRRNGYMQTKWFGSYKRTTNAVAPLAAVNTALESNHGFGGVKKSMRLEALPTKSYYCRDDFASKEGLRVGRLTAAFQGG
ncbi:uncharacterized protein [Pyrus communis]|uniref:uncharacterized protein n=1 Tax=Pyrus communis TaxID=23211 RepID=UPI0035C07A90